MRLMRACIGTRWKRGERQRGGEAKCPWRVTETGMLVTAWEGRGIGGMAEGKAGSVWRGLWREGACRDGRRETCREGMFLVGVRASERAREQERGERWQQGSTARSLLGGHLEGDPSAQLPHLQGIRVLMLQMTGEGGKVGR